MLKSTSAFSLASESCSPLLGSKFEAVPGGWRPSPSGLKTNMKASASMRSLASQGKVGKRTPRGGDQALIQALFLANEMDSFPSASSPVPGNYLGASDGSLNARLHRSPQAASARTSIDEDHDPHNPSGDLLHGNEKSLQRSSVVEGHGIEPEPNIKRQPHEGGKSFSRRATAEQAANTATKSREAADLSEDKGPDHGTSEADWHSQVKGLEQQNQKTAETEPSGGQPYTLAELHKLKDEGHGWNFKQEVFNEFAEAFIAFDKDGSRTLSPAELRPLLRSLGYVCTPRTIFELLQLAPPKNNEELDFRDYLKMIQVFTITEAEQMRQIFTKHDADNSGTINGHEIQDLLVDVGYSPTEEEVDQLFKEFDEDRSGSIDYGEFMVFYESFRGQERLALRKRAGFTPEEVTEMQETFEHYDKDHSGSLSKSELWKVLEDMALQPKTRDAQRRLEDTMDEADADGSETYDFYEFLWLMRSFYEVEEHNLFLREKKAIESCSFSPQEVTEFRNVFESLACGGEIGDISGVGGSLSSPALSSTAHSLTISMSDVKQILRGAGVALTSQTLGELRGLFEQFAHATIVKNDATARKPPAEGKMLDFPEFLLLISHMLNTNFANLSDSAKKTICLREKEQKNYEDLLQRVRQSVCEPTVTVPNFEVQVTSSSKPA